MSNNYYQDNNGLTLTAFVGGEKCVQLTLGMDYVTLTPNDCVKLAGALLERSHGNITATGEEKSSFNDQYINEL